MDKKKGQLREILLLWLFSPLDPIWAPVAFTTLFRIFEFAELVEFEIRSVL